MNKGKGLTTRGAVEKTEYSGDVLAQVDQAEAALPAMVRAGATEAILGLTNRARAQAEYEKLQGHEREATKLARLVIRGQASVGLIDTEENPTAGKRGARPPLIVGGAEAAPGKARGHWRTLAIALDRGALDATMDAMERAGVPVSTKSVCVSLRVRGDLRVPRAALIALAKKDGRTLKEIAALAGVSPTTFISKRTNAVGWWVAKKACEVLGADPRALPPAKITPKKHPKKRDWVKRQLKPTGGRWDDFAYRLQLVADEFDRLVGNTNPQDDADWEHLKGLRERARREQQREQLS